MSPSARNKPVDLHHYIAASKRLREAEAPKFAAAAKVHALDYSRTTPIYCELPMCLCSDAGTFFWRNLDELVEVCHEEDVPLPLYVWATQPRPLHLDATEILETADEEVSDAALKELQALLDGWGSKHAGYTVDYTRAVLLAESADQVPPPKVRRKAQQLALKGAHP